MPALTMSRRFAQTAGSLLRRAYSTRPIEPTAPRAVPTGGVAGKAIEAGKPQSLIADNLQASIYIDLQAEARVPGVAAIFDGLLRDILENLPADYRGQALSLVVLASEDEARIADLRVQGIITDRTALLFLDAYADQGLSVADAQGQEQLGLDLVVLAQMNSPRLQYCSCSQKSPA